MKRFKYQTELDELMVLGCQLPDLFSPNNMLAFRFAFSSDSKKNHLPQYKSNPRRMLQDIKKGNATTSLLSLSCFDQSDKAETFYANLCRSFRNAPASLGDTIVSGMLTNEDGLKTMSGKNGHFDFYEYEGM